MQNNTLKIERINKRITILKKRIIHLKQTHKHCDINKNKQFDVIQDEKDEKCESYYKESYNIMCEIDKLISLKKEITNS
jgi:hypothetical protein